MAVKDDILQIVMKGRVDGSIETRNVWYYLFNTDEIGGQDAVEELVTDFNIQVVTPILNITPTNYEVLALESINLFNETELYEAQYTHTGIVTGDPTSSFVTASFRTPRTRRDIRRGYKRIGPLAESDVVGNGIESTAQTRFDNVADSFELSLTYDTNTSGFLPVIVKRIKESDGSGGYNYRLPVNQAEADYFFAVEWLFQTVTSQVSRK